MMRAAVVTGYGGPEMVRVATVPDPVPRAGELLVRVHAAGLNPLDRLLRSGAVRRSVPLRFPAVLGFDLAGFVEAVGADVVGWSIGDCVYGRTDARSGGTHAERAVVRAEVVDRIPAGLTFAEAASLPLVAMTALQAVDLAEVGPGHRVLVTGAAGGVGSAAVQIAQALGADVVAGFRRRDHHLARRLGVRSVVLDRDGDALSAATFDGIVDTVSAAPSTMHRSLLALNGRYVTTGFSMRMLLYQGHGLWSRQRFRYVRSAASGELMRRVSGLVRANQLRPIIDTVYPLERIGEAYGHLDRGGVTGKLVVATV